MADRTSYSVLAPARASNVAQLWQLNLDVSDQPETVAQDSVLLCQ